MTRTCCFLAFAAVAMFGNAQAAARIAGSAFCAHEAMSRSCQARWKWDAVVGPHQELQRFDLDAATWVNEQELIGGASGTSQTTMRTAHLYRVQACGDSLDASSCVSTSAFWSPEFPAVMADVPDFVVTGRGRLLGVSKGMSLEAVTAQYNVYLMVTALEGVDMSVMPPMTSPSQLAQHGGDAGMWDDLQTSLYEEYSGLQQISKVSRGKRTPGFEGQSPEFIDEVPAASRAGFRAERLTGWPASTSITFSPAGPIVHTITVFADIDCQHCRQIFHDLPELTALGIQVRFMAFPIAGIDSPAAKKMSDVWCSADPKAMFERAMRGETIPSADCERPIVPFHYALGRRMGLQGSPSIVSERGDYIGGYLSPSELLSRLRGDPPLAAD